MSRNVLQRKDSRLLEDLVHQHREEIKEGKWNKSTFAEYAARKMSVPVTPNNVERAAEVMEVQFQVTPRADTLQGLRQLSAAVKLLAKDLMLLRGELGVVSSPTLRALCGENLDGPD